MTVREQIEQVIADSRRTPATRSAEVARLRAVAAVDAFAAHSGRNLRGELTVRTRAGAEVRFSAVEFRQSDDGVSYVDIRLGGQTEAGDPHFRVFNPPTLVEDPRGDVLLGDGRRYREDPLGALAEVVAGNGGGRTR